MTTGRRSWAGVIPLLLALGCERVEREGVPSAPAPTSSGSAGASSVTGSVALPAGLRVVAIEAQGAFVYLVASDAVYRVPKGGGELTRLSSAEHWVHGIAGSEGFAYFVKGNAVARIDERDGAVAPLYDLSGTARVWSIAAGHGRLAVIAPGCGRVTALGIDGNLLSTATQSVSDSVGGTVPVAIGSDAVYCGGGIGGVTSSKIFRYQPPSDTIDILAELGPTDAQGYTPEATALVELGAKLYFTRGYGVMRQRHSLEVVPVGGGDPKLITEFDALAPQDLRFHPTEHALYWLSVSEPFVVRYSLATGAVTTQMLPGLPRSSFALDESSFYYTTDATLERVTLF